MTAARRDRPIRSTRRRSESAPTQTAPRNQCQRSSRDDQNSATATAPATAPATATEVNFIGGRAGVDKPTAAAAASRILAAHGSRHAVIEGDNVDQTCPEPWREGIAFAGQNLTAMWSAYRALGYHRLPVTTASA